MRLQRILVLVTFACTWAHACAWIDTGHMVIGAIAEKKLSLKAKKAVNDLLRVGGDNTTNTIMTATCWADDVKTAENGPWHYINIHFRADGSPASNAPLKQNVVWAIGRMIATLEDKNQPKSKRADALRFLLHFVGDVHQPMHCVARDTTAFPNGDRGGNEFKVGVPSGWAVDPRQLHLLWDFGCGEFMPVHRPLEKSVEAKLRAKAAGIMAEFPESRLKLVGEMDAYAWAGHGHQLARTRAYMIPEGSIPSESYLRQGRELSRQQAALAGYRLARILNRIFG